MQRVLIYTDDYAISQHKNNLDKMIPYIQEVYNRFLSIGVTVNLNDLKPMLYSVIRNDVPTESIIERFVTAYLVNKAGDQSFNGVGISVETLIKKPDLSLVVEKINEYFNYYGYDNGGYTPEKMQVVDGVVSKTATAFEEIEERFTYYSENDRGAEIATMLFDLAQRLNDARGYFGISPYSNQELHKVYGLERFNNSYRPDLTFIRHQEKAYPNYVAPEQPED